MTTTTPPPAIYQYDALWNGSAHRNFCVAIRNGKTTIKVDGMPDYQLYFVVSSTLPRGSYAIFAEGLGLRARSTSIRPTPAHQRTRLSRSGDLTR